MTIDLKTLTAIFAILSGIVAGAMGYGSLSTRVKHLEDGSQDIEVIRKDVTEIKMDMSTLMERTKQLEK